MQAEVITSERAEDIRARYATWEQWFRTLGRNHYHPDEVPADCKAPTNEERSALEVYDFVNDPPDSYFLYIRECKLTRWDGEATTWAGDRLGWVCFGSEYRSNMGDIRVPVTIKAINGKTYHGTFYKSAGDYARIRAAKEKKAR